MKGAWNDYPECPHCGAIDYDWWDGTSMKNDGDEEDAECGKCGKPYSVTMSVSVSFFTEDKEP